ncbi:glycoside hydrolase family 47 protein [Sphaerobolus stellatus SS14]|uniref:alpha-1,2-Mannosidase n=1 Tax=Sphaerobolus stellatus (strain SS14) TaxID=990650 RepID=A0A0C9VV16_SPHS4|nr:glycoside hydrolase family 47 protein [Sphaerobolus stellatus SS14]
MNRRPLLSRLIKSRAARVGTLVAVFLLLVLILWSSPSTTRPYISPDKPIVIPAFRKADPKTYQNETDTPNWEYRRDAVKDAFLHAYSAYEENAFPADEYWPLTKAARQNFNGWGVSVVDSLDTMLLMGLDEEFRRGLKHVQSISFDLEEDHYAHFFETTIRYLGGLLSAYALSKEPVLLRKADELGNKLLHVFNTPSGLPTYSVNTRSGKTSGGSSHPRVLLAEIGSCQLEYRYLAHLTGNGDYFRAVEKVNAILQINQNQRSDALWASHWETENGTQTNAHLSVGAWADSAYEYILKQYLQTSKSEKRFKRMHVRSTRGVLDTLLYLSPTRNLLYVTDTVSDIPTRKLEHLSCFYPGLLALAGQILDSDNTFMTERDKNLHRWSAEGLAHTCWVMYGESPSGLGPEEAIFDYPPTDHSSSSSARRDMRWMHNLQEWEQNGSPGGKPPGVANLASLMTNINHRDYRVRTSSYLLRPETIESMYLMWKTTGDPIWRERGWEIFKAIEKYCRLSVGYSSVADVSVTNPKSPTNKLNDMPSYALAETWKYLYLLFSPEDPMSLDKWVFNTEAHPLPVFEWNEAERKEYRLL